MITRGGGPVVGAQVKRGGAVAGGGHDLDVGLGVQQDGERGPDYLLVVGDDHADGHAGSLALIRYPPLGAGPAQSSPPRVVVRSRMPVRPWPARWSGAGPGPVSRISMSSVSSR